MLLIGKLSHKKLIDSCVKEIMTNTLIVENLREIRHELPNRLYGATNWTAFQYAKKHNFEYIYRGESKIGLRYGGAGREEFFNRNFLKTELGMNQFEHQRYSQSMALDRLRHELSNKWLFKISEKAFRDYAKILKKEIVAYVGVLKYWKTVDDEIIDISNQLESLFDEYIEKRIEIAQGKIYAVTSEVAFNDNNLLIKIPSYISLLTPADVGQVTNNFRTNGKKVCLESSLQEDFLILENIRWTVTLNLIKHLLCLGYQSRNIKKLKVSDWSALEDEQLTINNCVENIDGYESIHQIDDLVAGLLCVDY